MTRQILLAVISLLIIACGDRSTSEAVTKQDRVEGTSEVHVIGYSFNTPESSQGFSMLNEDGSLNLDKLSEYKDKESALTKDQVKQLRSGGYGDNPKFAAAACYDPHHIFVFYSDEDEVLEVIEVCFMCTNLRTSPELDEEHWCRHDFRSLARLCDEIGLLNKGRADNYIRAWDGREHFLGGE